MSRILNKLRHTEKPSDSFLPSTERGAHLGDADASHFIKSEMIMSPIWISYVVKDNKVFVGNWLRRMLLMCHLHHALQAEISMARDEHECAYEFCSCNLFSYECVRSAMVQTDISISLTSSHEMHRGGSLHDAPSLLPPVAPHPKLRCGIWL
jgi:hypothetical protein